MQDVIDIAGAGHLSFTTTCTRPKTLPTKPTPAEQEVLNTINAACRPDLTDPQHVHQLTQRYTIAFFKTHLTGNTTYNHWLTPTEGATLDPA